MVSIEGNGKAAVAESLTRGDEDGYVVQMVRRAYRWLGAEIRTLPAQDLLRGHLYLVRIAQSPRHLTHSPTYRGRSTDLPAGGVRSRSRGLCRSLSGLGSCFGHSCQSLFCCFSSIYQGPGFPLSCSLSRPSLGFLSARR